MKVSVRTTKEFRAKVKPLLKKYHSLSNDLLKLESELLIDPRLGTPLGHNAYKIRLRIGSKGKGKSGGARVISLLEQIIVGQVSIEREEVVVNLLIIYDKGDVATISDKELRDLIKAFHSEK